MQFSVKPGDAHYLWVMYPLFVLALIFLAVAIRRVLLGIASGHWPTREAQVVVVEIKEDTDSDGDPWFEPRIRYQYGLDDGGFRIADTFSYKILSSTDYRKVREQVAGMRPGVSIRIHCDPSNERRSVLIPGTNFANYVAVAVALLMLALVNNGIRKHELLRARSADSHPAPGKIEPANRHVGILRFTTTVDARITSA